MNPATFDDRQCVLGEGPLWHPDRAQLFWFDITGKRLLTRTEDGPAEWVFDRHVSAAGWVDQNTLLVATETDLVRFDLETGAQERVAPLEAGNPATRSNDGRADPFGGFWIGTMGKSAEAGAGALYRYYRGEVVELRDGITIPNATCFSPDGGCAYFADTAEHIVWRIPLDAEGWPSAEWEVWLDHREARINPDGAVVDAVGRFWCAEWGGARVACYDPSGKLVEEIRLDVPQPTCPAFGGGDLSTLFVTTARQGLPDDAMDGAPRSGMTLSIPVSARGQAEHRVIL
jgi:sugar lactone lactonase YvrE